MTQRRKGRERERDGFLGDLGRARAEKRRERASNLLAPSVGLGRPLLLVRSPSLALSPLFHFRAAFEVGEGEGEGEEGKRRRRKRLRESELCSVGNLLRKLFKAPDLRLEKDSGVGTRVKTLPRYMLHGHVLPERKRDWQLQLRARNLAMPRYDTD